MGCSKLLRLEIPHAVSEIGTGAFAGCCSLEDLSLPRCLKHLGEAAFQDCGALRRLRLPEGLCDDLLVAFQGLPSTCEVTRI